MIISYPLPKINVNDPVAQFIIYYLERFIGKMKTVEKKQQKNPVGDKINILESIAPFFN